MKKTLQKAAALLCALVLLTAAFSPAVYALDFIGSLGDLMGSDFGEILSSILGGGGGGGNGVTASDLLSDPAKLLENLRERLFNISGQTFSDSEILTALVQLLTNGASLDLNSNDFINGLLERIRNEPTTQAPTTEPTTEEPTTEEPATEAPTTEPTTAYTPQIVIPSTSNIYQGADPYTVTDPTTTEPSYYYTEPPASYTSPVTTVEFTPTYQEEKANVGDNNALKLVIGFALISAAVVAIVVVVLKMKKTSE